MSQIRQPSIADLVVYLSSCTEEDRQLFEKECSILLECRACKSIFRSFMNFCSHKRTFCRAEAHEILNTNAGNSGDYTSPKKVAGLRRTNLTKHVSRKADVSEIQVCAEDIHIPPSDNIAEKLPPDRVLLLQPQAYPSRYRGMSLRMRLKGDNTRVISKEEVECVERLLTYFHDDVEPALGRCLYSSCSDISPFGSVWALAYHMSVKHSQKEESTNAIPCLMCSKKFTTWGFFCSHLNRKHKQIKLDHLSQRRKEADEVINKKKAKKVRTIPRSTNGVIRCRSLSPELHPVDTQEVGNLNLSVESKDSDEKLDVNLNPIPTDSVECCNIRTSNDGTSSGERVPRQLKCRRIRHSLIRLEGDGQQQSMTNSRERRKRKIPARYRDDDTSSVKDEMLVKTKDCSGSTCVSQDTSSLAPMACENSILEDVTAVMRLLVCTVVETYQEVRSITVLYLKIKHPRVPDQVPFQNISDTLVTNVRSRSSRLRKRPDWMDNEDFFIVDDRKYRRDGPNETSISPVFNQGDSMSSNSL
uniref:C2H2-type domain-containing protein n=1 Tax=Angiostrongylus cantonensis TaxID=6313 RepID=A0A0K0DQN5_ANGCA